MSSDDYTAFAVITGILVFICSYIYCIASYGFLFGVGLGWLPSIIVAVVAGALWPRVWFVIASCVLLIALAIMTH